MLPVMFLHLRLIQISKEKKETRHNHFLPNNKHIFPQSGVRHLSSIQNSWGNLSPQTGIDNNYIYLPKIQVLPREALATDHTIQELQCLLTSEKKKSETNKHACWLIAWCVYIRVCV